MTPPPLPPGVEGHPVCPDIHTGLPEPDRDGWTGPDAGTFDPDAAIGWDEHVDRVLAIIQPEAS